MNIGCHILCILLINRLTKALRDWKIKCISNSSSHARSACKTCIWVFCKSLQDNHCQSRRYIRIDQGGSSGRGVEVLRDHSHGRLTSKRWHARHHFIENDPKRINVTALIARIAPALLWRTVELRPGLGRAMSGSEHRSQLADTKAG